MAIVKQTEIAGAGKYPNNKLNQRERKVVEVTNQYAPGTSGDWATVPATIDAALNSLSSSGVASTNGPATASVVWDFAVNGGAVSSIPLSVTLPDNAIIVEVIADVITQITGSGTVQLTTPTDGAIQAGTLATADTAIPKTVSPAAPKKLTAARVVQVTIATAVVTAGRIRFHIRYLKGE
jgi:hypothetical protein